MEEVSGIFPSSGREPHGLGSLLLKVGRNVKGKLTGIQKLSLDPGKPRTLSQRDPAIAQQAECSRCSPSITLLPWGSSSTIHICTITH